MMFYRFVVGSLRAIVRGPKLYYLWLLFLVALIAIGAIGYADQLKHGLVRTNMRDQVSWGFYIGNFTFMVGVAAAAVVLVIPAYIYNWKPIKEIVIIGELLAVCAIVTCLLFVMVDIGRPDRFWHIMPFIGNLHIPSSLLAWDSVVLNVYFVLNLTIVTHLLYRAFNKKPYSKRFATPLIILSIPAAVSIHTVTAFLYNGLASRPYWNSAILAPRFIASAFCSGPAIILILLQLLRRYAKLEIKNEALSKIAELMAYAMFVNLFLFGAEIFREYYSSTEHLVYTKYLFSGVDGHRSLVPYAWLSLFLSGGAFLLFLIPSTRRHPVGLNLGAFMIYGGVFIEKGIALVVPGFTPSTLGDIYEYVPSRVELMVTAGIYGIGALLFTLMVKVAVPIMGGHLTIDTGSKRATTAALETPQPVT
ncbi:MAG: polysulfide reductase NrfD [Deltaproteobacteria bacterium]|nr:polysulfide reductase NrfD [Deltaproteobacteria bacterium]